MMTLEGQLPVAIAPKGTSALTHVVMTQLTIEQSLKTQMSLKPDQFVVVGELAAMTKLVDHESGESFDLTYEMLGSSSRQNLDYLTDLRASLDVKERADSTK
ncbi:MAG: hypothetical protein RLY58_533 [Pseudomonadota bacterium]|jgi:hypothetical protein